MGLVTLRPLTHTGYGFEIPQDGKTKSQNTTETLTRELGVNHVAASLGTFIQVVSAELLALALWLGTYLCEFTCHLGWNPLQLTKLSVFNRCPPCFLRLLLSGCIIQLSLELIRIQLSSCHNWYLAFLTVPQP